MPSHYRGWDPTADWKRNLQTSVRVFAAFKRRCGGDEGLAVSVYAGHGACRSTRSSRKVQAILEHVQRFRERES